jgi:hypothetical protein
MKRKTSNKPLTPMTWETLGVETVSLPPLTETIRLVEDIQARVDMIVPSVNEGQFVRIWSTEVQNDPRSQPLEFLESIFENHLVAEIILAYTPGRRVEFPFQGNWGNGIGQLNPACSGELYVGHGTMQIAETSKVEKFLLGRVMDGILYLREYHFSPERFFEARRGIAKVESQPEFKTYLKIFSWPVKGNTTPGIEKKTCTLQVRENISDLFPYSWRSSGKGEEYEIEFVKDCPVEFVLAKQVDVDISSFYFTRKAENVWRPVEGPCAKSFFPGEGCIFPVVNHIKDRSLETWHQSLDYRARIPIMVQGEVYIINSEFVKQQAIPYTYIRSDEYSCGLEGYFRAHVKASYDKDAFVKSPLLTKRMWRIFNRCKFVPKVDNLSTRSDRIRENLKLLALESGSKATFVEELTNRCKITEERAEEIFEDVKIDDPTTKKVQTYYCSQFSEWKVIEGAPCRKKALTNCPPPSSFTILGSRDANVVRRKRRKSRKTKAFKKSYQSNKERKIARKNREKRRTLARKKARKAKLEPALEFDYENFGCCIWGCAWCYGEYEEEYDDDESHHFNPEAETTTVKEMYDWFRQGFTTPRHENKDKRRSNSPSVSQPHDEARYVKHFHDEDIAAAHGEKMESLTVDVQFRKPKRKSPKSWPTPEKQDVSRKRRSNEKLRTKQRKAARDFKKFNLVRN